ncbi:Chaperone protein dnaJ 49 [Hirschfeldia incana]|nr:Chaperone protein dnaJ 49 [Hirschfeldia incana]
MDGNKDDAARCVRIAEESIASGDKERALRFINMAKRLNPSLSTDELTTACENLDSVSENPSLSENHKAVNHDKVEPKTNEKKEVYTEENVELVRSIKRNNDYYTILGLEKNCSVEEIRKAYRKLSLKVHPDKNKAPGSEEAFKKVSKAFTCLSDGNSRSQYDQVGFVDEFDHIQRQQTTRRPRRRRYTTTRSDFFEDEFDPDEIFRAFFGQQRDVFGGATRAYRARQARAQPPREEEVNFAGPTCVTMIQILPFLLLLLLAYLPFSEPDYSLHKSQSYQVPKTTENMEISFYVRSSPAFDEKYPLGSSARANLDASVIKEYRSFLFQSCRIELQRRRWNKKLPTPHCNELHDRGFVDRQIPI